MTVKELIKVLESVDPEADVFIGSQWGQYPGQEEKVYELYSIDPEELKVHQKVRSCKSGNPSNNDIKENVLILEAW